ncbi:MAG: hypothetical protein F4Y00_05110 [Bacteroidetes bacterium SB0662_bin_6]|nr:hypothetical protein [Bacteroidetes bacterium SB0668_bin_1]MYE04334.1 hypothetical protein [Bacteroidetes bacterium SB0662_bin_6]
MPEPDTDGPNADPGVEQGMQESAEKETPAPEPVSLDALRRRVEEAVRVIEALRATNAALLKKMSELEKRPAIHRDHAFFSLPRNPDALKDDLRSFIETLDEYMERERDDA